MPKTILAIICTLFPLLSLANDLYPDPGLQPTEVVKYQLDALKQNRDGEGIEATFRFASPANKSQTGPLSRFSKLFDNPQYSPMLNHFSADVEILKSNDGKASVGASLVDKNGDVYWYQFDLSRQNLHNCEGCWMTDAVFRIEQPGNSA